MNVRLRRLSPWLLLMLALQLAGAAIAIANQEWAILERRLARDRDELSDRRGVLTPASAMGDVLLKRLAAIGVTVRTAHLV